MPHGKICYLEIPANRAEDSARFYSDIFGWKVRERGDGNLAFDLGHLPAGSKHVLYLDYQVNPTTVGSRTLRLELQDGETPVTSLERTLRILP